MGNELNIVYADKQLQLRLTPAARRELAQRTGPLYVEMELYFSCMIRKRLRFYDQPLDVKYAVVMDKLHLGFRPVMTQQCSIHQSDGPPPVTDFPIARVSSFIPHWLSIDFLNGVWSGEFGYNEWVDAGGVSHMH